mgnify:CR=1 FL=1
MWARRSPLQVLEQEQLLDGQQHKVIQAPADEIPVGTVPDAGEQLDHKQVEDLPLEALAFPPRGIYTYSRNQPERVMCQRRQNSVMEAEM